MEVSPAKSLGIVSDSEGEEDRAGMTMDDMFEREVNAARSTDPRDWPHLNQPATIATNLSSHISQFNTLPGQALAMQADSSAIDDFDWSATKPRPRPRPRMRPVPPPEQLESSSIGAFPTMPPVAPSIPETVASFDNSAVQGVPTARPPSLPPSSLPGPDSSSSIPIPTFPTSISPSRPQNSMVPPNVVGTSSSIVPPTPGAEAAPKRPRPKMRPPPPPEPEATAASVATTTSSTATTSLSTNPNTTTSTAATSVSSSSKSGPSLSSALDQAEEFTGRGARRLGHPSKPAVPPPVVDADVDVGGPEDNTINDVIMLLSSDDEYGGSKAKTKAKPKPKPKPKPKKKDGLKADSTPAQSDNPGEQVPAPAKSTSKRKSTKNNSSDDEFGRWDTTIPGGSAPTSKRTKSNIPAEGDGGSSAQPVVPNTMDPPNPNPTDGPGYRRATSSPLSSPGRSPELKRKDPPNTITGETVAPSPTKKSRKSDFVGVVLAGPPGDGKKPKRPRKKSAKAAAAEEESGIEKDQPYVPPALSSVADTSTSVVPSEPSKTKTTPSTSGEPSMIAPGPENVSMDVDAPATAATAAKKQPKKRAPKGKKGAAAAVTDEPVPADGSVQEDPAPKKSTKGKGKGKGKEKEETPVSTGTNDEVSRATSSNPDAGATPATSSNPNTGPATSSNPSAAPAQTPAPKPKPKPRHSTTPAPLPVAMGASGSLLRSASGKASERPLSETLRLALGTTGSPAPRMGLSRRGSSKIAPLLAFRGAPPPPPPPMPKKPTKKKKGVSDDEDSEEGPEWEGLTEKQKEKKRREKEIAGWYSDG